MGSPKGPEASEVEERAPHCPGPAGEVLTQKSSRRAVARQGHRLGHGLAHLVASRRGDWPQLGNLPTNDNSTVHPLYFSPEPPAHHLSALEGEGVWQAPDLLLPTEPKDQRRPCPSWVAEPRPSALLWGFS